MNPYGCIACGDEMGMIEVQTNKKQTKKIFHSQTNSKQVVGNSVTTAGIAREVFFFVYFLCSWAANNFNCVFKFFSAKTKLFYF
jgi:hypothetical protein